MKLKKMMMFAAAAAMTMAMSVPSLAYWQNDGIGYRYMLGKDKWLTSTYTEDGYWVDVNGYWDGKESIGIKNENGEFVPPEILPDPFEGLQILGKRILKSQGKAKAKLDDEKKEWTVSVDVYDTAFMTNDEIKAIKKGDSFELPGLGITVTAQNKASKGVIHTSSSGDNADKAAEANKNEDSGYRVRLQDEEGNQYILSAARLRKTSADSSTTETILRPVATDIVVRIPTWRDALRVNGTSHYTTTKKLVENGMMFEGLFKGDELQQINDVIYNYDTTNTPVYDEHAAHGHLYNIKEY